MSSVLSLDFETRSIVDLPRTSVYPYALHETTDIWCMAFAFDDDEPELWVPGDKIPQGLFHHVKLGQELRAWNAQFERVIWACVLHPRYGFPLPDREQWFCTMADAAALALPSALNRAALALGLDQEKDDEGYRLMRQMAQPRTVDEETGEITWWDDEERRQRLYAYCRQDVRVERAVASRIRRLDPQEREVYLLDQKMNDRGVMVDVPLVVKAQKVVDEGTVRANEELREITEGEVDKFTQVKRLKGWLNKHIEIDNLRKDTIRDFLEDEALPEDVHRAMEIRSESAKSSNAKLVSLLEYACSDDRARGMLQYHKASTGRWAGRGPQPQNFPRPELKNVEKYIPLVMATGDRAPAEKIYEALERASGEPALAVISSMLRSCFRAAPGTRFISGDFSQIEARTLAWIAEQEDLVELFESGGKVYEDMASFIYDIPVEEISKDSVERQIGKNSVLGAGYQMGAETFPEQVKKQTGIELDRGREPGMRCERCDWERVTTLDAALECPRCGQPREMITIQAREDMAKKAINGYRSKNHRIKAFWGEINDAAMAAVKDEGSVQHCGRRGLIRFTVRGQFLWCILPSGRPLAYALPSIRRHTVKPKDPDSDPFETWAVSYMGVDSYTRKWSRQYSYGGKWTENVVQAMARDVMAEAMLRLEEAGYPQVLTVHDEALAEVPNGQGSLDEFLKIMRIRPEWAPDLPVEAEGWEGERYRK